MKIRGPSIAIVTEGRRKVTWGLEGEGESLNIDLGDVFFVGAGTRIELEASGVGELVIYRVFVEKLKLMKARPVSRRWAKKKRKKFVTTSSCSTVTSE